MIDYSTNLALRASIDLTVAPRFNPPTTASGDAELATHDIPTTSLCGSCIKVKAYKHAYPH